jgi:hypothetical protein
MSLKAKLSITLKADDVVIAETEDTKLWLKIFTSIIESSPAHAGGASNEHGQEHHQGGVSA